MPGGNWSIHGQQNTGKAPLESAFIPPPNTPAVKHETIVVPPIPAATVKEIAEYAAAVVSGAPAHDWATAEDGNSPSTTQQTESAVELQPAVVLQPETTAQPQPIQEEKTMSLWTDLESAGTKVETFLSNIASGAKKLAAIYSALSGPTIAAVSAVFYDVVKAVASGESAAASASTGNIAGAITLSETTITLVKQVVTDFKSGEKTIVADFEALGIKL
jgi:hypothetical protein